MRSWLDGARQVPSVSGCHVIHILEASFLMNGRASRIWMTFTGVSAAPFSVSYDFGGQVVSASHFLNEREGRRYWRETLDRLIDEGG